MEDEHVLAEEADGIAVLFATYNGASVLHKTLAAYVSLNKPSRPWRMIIVDNNSNDSTSEILESYRGLLPLTTIYAAEQGKNKALNKALDKLSQGDDFWIITDDDAIPDEDFLRAWEKVAVDNASADLFGGKVIPDFDGSKPYHLNSFKNEFDVLYAANERDSAEIAARYIFGPNMAVRARIFKMGYRFNERIGPNSDDKNYPMGSETEFCVRVEREARVKAFFSDQPSVRHQVRPHQTTMAYIAGRAYRHGYGFAMQNAVLFHRKPIVRLKNNVKLFIFKILWSFGHRHAFWQYNWFLGVLGNTLAADK